MENKNIQVNVWIMNLKDNRDEKPASLNQSKFDFCKNKGIVGIGWANIDPLNTQDTAFLQANKAIESFEIGDLVWVKNPNSETANQEQYLCRITSKAVSTGDEIMNSYDIGKYCKCEYLLVSELPDTLKFQKLTAVHTIERANELCKNETVSFYNSKSGVNNKSKKVKNKLIVCSVVIVSFILLSVLLLIPKINKMTHPVLPYNLEFGMSYDEVLKMCNNEIVDKTVIIDKKTYVPRDRKYIAPLIIEEDASVKPKFLSNEFCTLSFNEDDELYELSYMYSDDFDFSEVKDYYKKSLPNESSKPSLTGSYVVLSNDSIICDLTDFSVTITNSSYEPNIVEISTDAINDELNKLNYNVGYFSINLAELINECVDNIEVSHVLYNGRDEDYIINGEDFLKYASTSYVVTIHGDISQNPDIEYLKTNDIDVIRILFIFDENENLLACKTLDECDELYTCAVLLVTQ